MTIAIIITIAIIVIVITIVIIIGIVIRCSLAASSLEKRQSTACTGEPCSVFSMAKTPHRSCPDNFENFLHSDNFILTCTT